MRPQGEAKYQPRAGFFWGVCVVACLMTLLWCYYLGAGSFERASLAFVLCFASFGSGSLLGFMFTIFGDEKEPFGKIRKSIIALASGITGVGIGKATQLGKLLGSVHIFAGDSEVSSWFSVLLVLGFFVVGFYFMYFARKLVLNPRLAEAKRAMDRIQISDDVSKIAMRITEGLSQSLLLGRQFIDEVDELNTEEEKRLKAELFANDVNEFLKACDDDVRDFAQIQPGNVAMAARLHYYRIYFQAKDSAAREVQINKAIDWLNRALMRDPTNPDLQIKLADIFGMQGRYDEAVSIIERLERDDKSPQYVQQWLGYFLLFIDGREKDAIEQSLEFHRRFQDAESALFNASCGYAQLYTIELREHGEKEILGSENRRMSLLYLEQGIRLDEDLKLDARKHSERGDSFESLANDEEFLRITAPAPEDIASTRKSDR